VGFDVVNIAGRHLHLAAAVVPAHGTTGPLPDWLALDGEQTLRLGPNETKKVTLRLTPPATAAAGATRFRLKVYEVSLPEENNGFSEPVQLTLTAAPPAPAPKPWKLIGAIAAAIVLLVAAGGWFAYDRFARERVPDVVGNTLAEARAALGEAGLDAGAVTIEEPIRRDADGTVTTQTPAAGTRVDENTLVTLEVPRLPVMPDLGGQSLDAARALLEEQDLLETAVVDRPSIPGSDEQVTAQTPAAGTTVTSGQPVTVTIPQLPRMPDVQGRLLAQALTALEQAGIPPSMVAINEPLAGRDIGRVTAQVPDPKAAITAGASVALTVPRRPGNVAVPPLPDGATAADAERIFAQQGLQALIIEERQEPGLVPGLVLRTIPPVGGVIAENGTVRVHVLSTTVDIPTLRGQILSERHLQQLRKQVRVVVEERADFKESGCVTAQSAFDEARRGSRLTLWVVGRSMSAPGRVKLPCKS